MDIARLREDFPALKRYVWFQNGGVSITPAPVAAEHARLMRELFERGSMHIIYPDEEYPRRRRTVERIARFFRVAPEELAVKHGVSDGFQTVIRGLKWQEGDQIVTIEEEEEALYVPLLHLRDLYGVEVVKAPLVPDPDGQVKAVVDRITDRTRLVALSHVTTDQGFRLPDKEICRIARERGVLTFLDMAHSAGLYPMDLHDVGCDFAGILSYKWMYAPYASGVLYIREERLGDVQVRYASGRATKWVDFQTDTFELMDSAQRFQYGPWSWPLLHAWARSLDYLTDIGLDEIWQRTVDLTTRLHLPQPAVVQ